MKIMTFKAGRYITVSEFMDKNIIQKWGKMISRSMLIKTFLKLLLKSTFKKGQVN